MSTSTKKPSLLSSLRVEKKIRRLKSTEVKQIILGGFPSIRTVKEAFSTLSDGDVENIEIF